MPYYRRRRRGYRLGLRRRRIGGMLRRRYGRFRYRRFARRVETKKVVGNASDASIDQGGVITLLTPVAQGLDDGQRVGVKISARYLYIRCSLSNADAEATTGTNTKIRQLVVQDMRMTTGTAPTVAQILDDPTAGDRMIQSPLNRDRAGRFRILMDRVFVLNSTSAAVSGGFTADNTTSPYIQKRFWKRYWRLGGRTLRYYGANTTDVENGAIYLITLTDADEDGAFNVSWSFGYTDL